LTQIPAWPWLQLKPGANDAHLLGALHPTPAVCGRPQEGAQSMLAEAEPFDRGFYAGPFGWVSAGAAEFAVAIRSALVHPPAATAAQLDGAAAVLQQAGAAAGLQAGEADTLVSLFAGVGIVRGSDTAQEWAELDLKVRQYERLLTAVPPLAASPNVNLLWARLAVEELCRLGCNTFCVAPGEEAATRVFNQPLALC
jgi:isochorismate synthase/2-succinyl-5-enolpyruvyl-6-hydroxy-3-cyclohexene-1-carboxylate synthase/2-succinyl-6-hydroxy-2,4-cyclohexadiene-1-carboxylate synthase/O-succinylbenzoate synthase